MNFQPFRNLSFWDYFSNAILWGSAAAATFALVTLIFCLLTRDKELGKALRITSLLSFAITAYISCAVLTFDKDKDNHQIALHNVSQKYDVEAISYDKNHRGAVLNADTESPVKVIIKSQGKSRPAVIAQNMETFEPSLTDFDTGKPLDELLRK